MFFLIPLQKKQNLTNKMQNNSISVSRSSITRVEKDLKKLKNDLSVLIALKIYKPQSFRSIDELTLQKLREKIQVKEKTILQLKLML